VLLRNLIITLLLIGVPEIYGLGQENTDSLIKVLGQTKIDTSRSTVLNKLSRSYRNTDYNKSLEYAQEALDIAQKANFQKGTADALINIGMVYYRQHEFDKSMEYLNKAYTIFQTTKNNLGIATYFSSIGDIYVSRQDYAQAKQNYERALKMYDELQNIKGIIHANNSIGHTFSTTENYDQAMTHYLKSLSFAQKLNDKKEVANCYINVANMLNAQSDNINAIKYLQKSVSIFEQVNDSYNMGVCYNNIAANYIDLDSINQAMAYLDKSLAIYIKLDDKRGQAACYLNMGIISSKSNQHLTAIKYYKSALKLNEQLNDRRRIAVCIANMTISFLKTGKYNEAIANSEKGLAIADEMKLTSLQSMFYQSLSSSYDSLKLYEQAFKYHKLFKQASDSVLNSENRKLVLEMEAKYQNERKEIVISNLTKDNELQQVQIEKNRNMMVFLAVISVLVLILSIVFYRLYDLKRKSETALKELNATKDKFFTIIAHDIKNPLSAYRSVTKMLTTSFYELSEQRKLEHIRGIHKSSENLYNLFQNLLQWSTSQSGSLQFKPQQLDLAVLAYKSVATLQESADKKNIQLQLDIKPGIYAYGDINMVSTIFTNLISNAIKYSHPDSSITINSTETGQFIQVGVIDSGIGISKEDTGKLFRVDVDHKTIGNSEEKGTGIGLILCMEFVTRNGGKLWVLSETGRGSAFYFTLPKELAKMNDKAGLTKMADKAGVVYNVAHHDTN